MGSMRNYVLRRIIFAFITVVLVSILTFFIVQLAPGGPIEFFIYTNPKLRRDPVFIDTMIKRMGLDKPWYIQYILWFKDFIRGDFGWSFVTGAQVKKEILVRIPVTLILSLSANILAVLIAVPLGVISSIKQYSAIDNIIMLLCLFGISVPTFWFGILLIYYLGLILNLFPISGIHTLGVDFPNVFSELLDFGSHMILPVFSLSITQIATTVRLTRSSLLEVLNMDYINTARAKGVPENVILYKHALKNALLPVVTVFGYSLAFMLAGSVLIESIFAIPGIGRYLMSSITQRDYPAIMATSMMIAIMVVVGNLLTDISYAFLDPRVRYE
jgi:peptide/nickel transport system permease protein